MGDAPREVGLVTGSDPTRLWVSNVQNDHVHRVMKGRSDAKSLYELRAYIDKGVILKRR